MYPPQDLQNFGACARSSRAIRTWPPIAHIYVCTYDVCIPLGPYPHVYVCDVTVEGETREYICARVREREYKACTCTGRGQGPPIGGRAATAREPRNRRASKNFSGRVKRQRRRRGERQPYKGISAPDLRGLHFPARMPRNKRIRRIYVHVYEEISKK